MNYLIVSSERFFYFSPTASSLSLVNPLIPTLDRLFPRWFLGMLARATPHAGLQKMRHIVDVMHRTSLQVYEDKKRALVAGDKAVEEQLGSGRDIMSILSQFSTRSPSLSLCIDTSSPQCKRTAKLPLRINLPKMNCSGRWSTNIFSHCLKCG